MDRHLVMYIGFVSGKAVVNTSRKYKKVVFLEPYPDPLIIFAPDIKVALTAPNVPNFLVFMQMLIKEHFDFVFVHVSHSLRRNRDFITVFVPTINGQLVYICNIRKTVV
jgi:hypothetical protein